MRIKWTRENFIPKGAIKIADKKSDAIAYLASYKRWDGAQGWQLVAFAGKRQKPDLNYTYTRLEAAQKRIAAYFEGCQQSQAYKVKRMDEIKAARNAPIKLQVGTVLVGSYGYEQTNVVAYQVVELIGNRSVRIREIAKTGVGETGYMTGYVIPCPDSFTSEATRVCRVTDGNRVRLASYLSLSPWTGGKLYESSYA